MANYDPSQGREPVDYTGLKIGLVLLPVFALFAFLGFADMGLTVCIVLVAIMVAIKLHWNLRKHIWFWAVIVFIMALHVPLFSIIRWPQGNRPTAFLALPVATADFLIISGALWLAKKIFSKDSFSSDEKG